MDTGTIVRTILLVLAWINQILALNNISPIPVDEVTISTLITGVISLWTWWKNNSLSKEALQADEHLKYLKANKITSTGGAPVQDGGDK